MVHQPTGSTPAEQQLQTSSRNSNTKTGAATSKAALIGIFHKHLADENDAATITTCIFYITNAAQIELYRQVKTQWSFHIMHVLYILTLALISPHTPQISSSMNVFPKSIPDAWVLV